MKKSKELRNQNEWIVCDCGASRPTQPFHSCERNGLLTKNRKASDGKWYYICETCGRIIELSTGNLVVGRRDPDIVKEEVAGDQRPHKVVIEIKGGIIQKVTSIQPLAYVVIDEDAELGTEVMPPLLNDITCTKPSQVYDGGIKEELKKFKF